ncbi:MAG: cobalamin B12-binding domain-containing protein [Deltaproteobacteria bacterium]|nr:cobalamin B12-binding domain-containing protein [Deltaproteobacteria bacterium]
MDTNKNLLKEIIAATIAGDETLCVDLARQVLKQGMDPVEAIQEGFTRGMRIVGEKFASMEIFLPQVILAADAMNAALAVLKPHLLQGGDRGVSGVVVLGTMQGDIHDLGKDIVKTMLQAAGFTVHDLGRDVPLRQFIERAEETDADIIGASAILTTTMTYMPDLVALLDEMEIRDKFKVMVGGAPITREYAKKIGADGYGENAEEAVSVAEGLMKMKAGRSAE